MEREMGKIWKILMEAKIIRIYLMKNINKRDKDVIDG